MPFLKIEYATHLGNLNQIPQEFINVTNYKLFGIWFLQKINAKDAVQKQSEKVYPPLTQEWKRTLLYRFLPRIHFRNTYLSLRFEYENTRLSDSETANLKALIPFR